MLPWILFFSVLGGLVVGYAVGYHVCLNELIPPQHSEGKT